MALRLRRGTDAERLTITPVEGELIYTTDLQELWIGDGITAGGNKISGTIPQFLNDLTNVDAASPQIGQVLKWDGDNWVASDDEDTGVVEGASYKINILGPDSVTIVDSDTATFAGNFVGDGSGLTNLPIATDGSGIVEGSNYRINIVDDSSTVMLNTSTSTFTGNFVGDGSGLTNLPFSANGDGIVEGSNYRINIVDDSSTVMLNTSTSTFSGNFVGDGSGLVNLPQTIQSIFDLDDVFKFEEQEPNQGDVIIFDGSNFVSQKIQQIEGADSTIIVDANTNTFTGNFVGDGSQLTNLNIPITIQSIFDLDDVFKFEEQEPVAGDVIIFNGSNFVAQQISIIEGADSTIIVDANTNTFTGNFVGDGSGLVNLPSAAQSIFDLNDVFKFEEQEPVAGDVIIFDGSNFVAQKIRVIEGADSTIIVDARSNTFTGDFIGDGSGLVNLPITGIVEGSSYRINIIDDSSTTMLDTSTATFTGFLRGNVEGSLFSDDSTIIFDATNNTISAEDIIANGRFIGTELNVTALSEFDTDVKTISVSSNENESQLELIRNSETDISSDSLLYGRVIFGRRDVNGRVDTTFMSGFQDGFSISHDISGLHTSPSKNFVILDGVFSFGTFAPEANAKVHVEGNLYSTGYTQFGTLTTTERNNLTAKNGMVIYNSSDNRFQGYQNGAWINLDDGTSA